MIRWIAEIGSNHNKDLNRVFKLIDAAADIGCWGVKFQLFRAERLYAPEFKNTIVKMKEWELPEEFLLHISQYCKEKEINFICTVFDLEGVQTLFPYVDYLKIGSYELLWWELFKEVIQARLPWMFSAGMTTENMNVITGRIEMGEIFNNIPAAVFHCNSNYPSKPENCGLYRIPTLIEMIDNYGGLVDIGWSDHTVRPGIIYRAVSLGAKMVEFHFDLDDGKGVESSIGHCWKVSQIAKVIHNIRIGDIAEYSGNTCEEESSKWRTDPIDGLRPTIQYREELLKGEL